MLGGALKAAVVAAMLAALVATAWHALVTEPLIDRAIKLEEARHGGETEEPIVSRGAQRVGLGLALGLYGVSWALALGALFTLARAHLPGRSDGHRAALLGLVAFWAVALFPFLKYPANPPGVGDPDTIATRQILYFATLALSALGAFAALALGRRLRAGGTEGWVGRAAWPIALGAYAVYCAALYAVLPPNLDPTPVPADLLLGFRLSSALGLAAYWLVFSTAFGLLVGRWSDRASTRGRNPRPAPEPGQA